MQYLDVAQVREAFTMLHKQYDDDLAQLQARYNALEAHRDALRKNLYNSFLDLNEAISVGLTGSLKGRADGSSHLNGWYCDAEISLEWDPDLCLYRWEVWNPRIIGDTITGEGTDSLALTIQMIKSIVDKTQTAPSEDARVPAHDPGPCESEEVSRHDIEGALASL